jgi:hypothetical protein
MNGERDKILKMLEEGTISAGEAEELLAAIEGDDDPAAVETSYEGPDISQFRSYWQRPFTVATLVLLVSGSGLLGTRGSTGLPGVLRRLLFWPVTVLAALTAVITYLSKDGPWLHMRIRSADGDRIAINLPFPLHLLRGALRIATTQAPNKEAREKLDAAATFLEAVETADIGDPITIDVRDEGDNVQIFLV